jgi:N-acetylglucosaminyldiphosphoundecaprenol N-acetyl-beta-D-mannosaminyltransferase
MWVILGLSSICRQHTFLLCKNGLKMIDYGRHHILGINVSAVDYESAESTIVEAAIDRSVLAVSALAVHGLMTGALDLEHRYRLNHFDLLVPDGQPVRWALKWLHRISLVDRVYGPTLMLRVCRVAASKGLPIFLFGGTETLLAALCLNLRKMCPGLIIAGTRASRFRTLSAVEYEDLAEEIRASGAQIAFVGLGCPRQEIAVYELRDAVPMPLIAVGAAFNFHAGVLSQAPPLLQKYGLEWLFRLCAEPRRLWRRYLLYNPLYLLYCLAQKTGLKAFDSEDAVKPDRMQRYG